MSGRNGKIVARLEVASYQGVKEGVFLDWGSWNVRQYESEDS